MYRKSPQKQYRQPRTLSSSVHAQFRLEWDRGLDEAMEHVRKLRSEGWLVPDQTWMQHQVPNLAKNYEAQGFETKVVPIAKWVGEGVVFVAVKPKKGTSITVPSISPTPSAKPKVPRGQTVVNLNFTADKAEAKFVEAAFGRGYKPDDGKVVQSSDNYFIIDPERTWAFASRRAAPIKERWKKLFDDGKKLLLNAPSRAIFNNNAQMLRQLREAQKKGKTAIDFSGNPNNGVDISYVRKAMATLGGGDIRVFQEDSEFPAYFFNQHGDMIIIAPKIHVEDPSTVVNVSDLPKYSL
jgi:hypothetical protein